MSVSSSVLPLRHRYGAYFGWGSAIIMIVFAVVHLFRVDTFVPELAKALDISRDTAGFAAGVIVCMEVFALPFLMRMKLSALAQYISGAFSVIVPLVWLLISIWTSGVAVSTAQFGEFRYLESSWWLIAANSVWLGYSLYTLWALGYDSSHRSFIRRSTK